MELIRWGPLSSMFNYRMPLAKAAALDDTHLGPSRPSKSNSQFSHWYLDPWQAMRVLRHPCSPAFAYLPFLPQSLLLLALELLLSVQKYLFFTIAFSLGLFIYMP